MEDVISKVINSVFLGDREERFCSRVARQAILVGGIWHYVERALDYAFSIREPEHCWRCHLRHLKDNH